MKWKRYISSTYQKGVNAYMLSNSQIVFLSLLYISYILLCLGLMGITMSYVRSTKSVYNKIVYTLTGISFCLIVLCNIVMLSNTYIQ